MCLQKASMEACNSTRLTCVYIKQHGVCARYRVTRIACIG